MAEGKQMTHLAGSPNRLVASIFVELEEFLKKSGEGEILDEVTYTYKLKELMPFDALHRFCSVLQDVIYKISELSLKLQKELCTKELELSSESFAMDTGCIEEPAALGNVMRVELTNSTETGSDSNIGNLVKSFLVYDNEESKNYITLENSFYSKNPVRMVFDGSLASNEKTKQTNNTIVENGLDNNVSDQNKTNTTDDEISNGNMVLKTESSSSYSEDNANHLNNGTYPTDFYFCDSCSYVFPTAETLNDHTCQEKRNLAVSALSPESGDPVLRLQRKFVCSICLEEYRNFERVMLHIRKCEQGPYYCEMCPSPLQAFETRKLLNSHKTTAHKGEASFICSECNASFRHKCSLIKHKVKSHEKSHKPIQTPSSTPQEKLSCDICGEKYIKMYNLINHKVRVHGVHPKYPCHICKEEFESSSLQAEHCLNVHGITEQKKFRCEYCDKGYNQKHNWKAHVERYHSTERSYSCSECGKGFSRRYKLVEHQNRHSGSKPYRCRVEGCTRAFVSNSDLKAHIKKHHAENAEALLKEVTGKSAVARMLAESMQQQQQQNQVTPLVNKSVVKSNNNSGNSTKSPVKSEKVFSSIHLENGSTSNSTPSSISVNNNVSSNSNGPSYDTETIKVEDILGPDLSVDDGQQPATLTFNSECSTVVKQDVPQEQVVFILQPQPVKLDGSIGIGSNETRILLTGSAPTSTSNSSFQQYSS